MKYQLADAVNGAFGEIFNSLEAAEAALSEAIAEGQAMNDQLAADCDTEAQDAADFFEIVEA